MAIVLDTNIQNARKPLKKLPNVITSFNFAGWERYGKRFIVRADEMLTDFLELHRAIHEFAVSLVL